MSIELIVCFLFGGGIGIIFFGGLWWTVNKAINANNPALWFMMSTLVRISLAISGFYFVMAGDWQRLLAALIGFTVFRMVLTRFSPPPVEKNHAS